jgi:hypothetical protein
MTPCAPFVCRLRLSYLEKSRCKLGLMVTKRNSVKMGVNPQTIGMKLRVDRHYPTWYLEFVAVLTENF